MNKLQVKFNDFLNEDRMKMPKILKTTLDGIYYHGTAIEDDDFFEDLDTGHSDWNAIWFTSDENIAQEFSDEKAYNDETLTQVVFQVKLKSKKIADINYNTAEDIKEYYDFRDIRECIPMLINKGFDGWFATGSIGYSSYDDIAIFNEDCIQILSASFKIDDNWTEYIPISEAEEYFNNILEKNK